MLEANLADYSIKRAELMHDLAAKPVVDADGEKFSPEDVSAFNAARAERTLELCQYDSYQRGLQSQIQILSTKFAELLRDDEKLAIVKGEGTRKTILNIQQLNVLLGDSAKRLAELEAERSIKNVTPKSEG